MNIIKLNAIGSTNTFLKELSATKMLDNYTSVVAESQLKGRGQRGSNWQSENEKNLTFSTFINDFDLKKNNPFLINIIVPISIIEVLETYFLENLAIKWPNDILSENKKIGGILIENVIKSEGKMESIIGIGLNVNQMSFDDLPKASSLALLKQTTFDKDILLKEIVKQLQLNLTKTTESSCFWDKYHSYLFKKEVPSVFMDATEVQFMGIIKKVTSSGKLQLLLEDDSLKEYDIKELKMFY